MYTYYTKTFNESLFETIADWLNSFKKPEELSLCQYSVQIIDYSVIPGGQTKPALAVITIRVFTAI